MPNSLRSSALPLLPGAFKNATILRKAVLSSTGVTQATLILSQMAIAGR